MFIIFQHRVLIIMTKHILNKNQQSKRSRPWIFRQTALQHSTAILCNTAGTPIQQPNQTICNI